MFYRNRSPPLGLIVWPTKWFPSLDARNKYAGVISSILAIFPLGIVCLISSILSAGNSDNILVSVAPGATQFTLMFLSPISSDNDLVNEMIAPFAAV